MNKGLLLASALAIAIPAAFGGNAIAPLVSLGEVRAAWGASAQPLSSLLQPHQWVSAGQWVNTGGLHPQDLRGKVVLVNFWTYSCINSLRALPYVRAWAAKYKQQGLVVIGVHTPEFGFEKDPGNVAQALARYGVDYPVVLDSSFHIWNAFDNEAWPAIYLIGPDGRVHRRVLGEGDYDATERAIRDLLDAARKDAPGHADDAAALARGPERAADLPDLQSPETYVGYDKGSNLASADPVLPDTPQLYRPLNRIALNHWALSGRWQVGGEYTSLAGDHGGITYRFHARDLHLVLAPGADGKPIRFRVTIDGKPPGASHGSDTDAEGAGTVREPRLYQLVRQAGPVTDRTFRVEFLDPGVRAYAFTFG